MASILVVVCFSYQNALFLHHFPAGMIPWFYMAVAISTVILSLPYTHLLSRSNARRQENRMLAIFLIGLFPGILLNPSGWSSWWIFLLAVWIKILAVFVYIGLWHQATRLFISRRAKVILPLAAAGFSLGSAVGGWGVRLVSMQFGHKSLLILLACLILLFWLLPLPELENPAIFPESRKTAPWPRTWTRGWITLRDNRLAFRLALFILLAIPVLLGTDFLFKRSLQSQWSADAIASFLGNYFMYSSLAVFALQTLVMGRLMRRLGVSRMTLLMPAFLLVTLPLVWLFPVFPVIAAFAIATTALKSTVYLNARNQLITPMSPLEKDAASLFLRSVITPLGTVTASLALLPAIHLGTSWFASGLFLLSLLFLGAGAGCARAYRRELENALARRTLHGDAGNGIGPVDGKVITHLRERLFSDSAEEVIFSATLLAEFNELRLTDLETLYQHPGDDTGICADKAVSMTPLLPLPDQERFFARILQSANDPKSCLRILDALSEHPSRMRLGELSGQNLHPVQKAARTILTRPQSGPEGFSPPETDRETESLILDPELGGVFGKRLALRLIGHRIHPTTEKLVRDCLDSGDPDAIREAVQTIALFRLESLHGACIQLMMNPDLRRTVMDACCLAGLDVDFAHRAFSEKQATGIRMEWVRVLCHSPHPQAPAWIRERLAEPDPWIHSIIATGLARSQNWHPEKEEVRQLLFQAADACRSLIQAENLFDEVFHAELRALRQFWQTALFGWLRILVPGQNLELLRMESSIVSTHPHRRNAGMELWEAWCPRFGFPELSELHDAKAPTRRGSPEPDRAALLYRSCRKSVADQLLQTADSGGKPDTDKRFIPHCLRRSGFFSKLPTDVLAELVEKGKMIELSEGQVLFGEGSSADAIFFVFSGEMTVRMGTREINRLHAGAVFGEIAVLDGGTRTAGIQSVVPSLVFAISREVFLSTLQDHPFLIRQLATLLATRIRDLIPLAETSLPQSSGRPDNA